MRKEYITNDLLEKFCENILLYARCDMQNNSKFDITIRELLRFLGIILLSGYHSLPSEQDFWSNQLDLGVTIVSEALSSKRFLQIKSMFHLVHNHTLDGNNDKIAKVALLYDSLNESFVKYGFFHKYLSVNESMVPYFGHHSCKMFIRSKPIRFGYNSWCLCGSDGYPYHFTIYSDLLKHELFFDHFFTSYNLLADLAAKNVKAIGTVRENRTLGASNKMK